MSLVKANGAGEVSTGFYNGVATQSVKLDGNSALTITHDTAPTLQTKGTVSTWIKLHDNNDRGYLIQTGGTNNNNTMDIRFGGSQTNQGMHIGQYGKTPYSNSATIRQRDFTNWYHLLVSFDSTSSTASERLMKIFINGSQVTDGTFGAISQDEHFALTIQSQAIYIGRHTPSYNYFISANVADFHIIDGQALTPDSFTEIKNGICIPKAYSGTYGNNGFRLEFKEVGTSQNASGIGADTSGNDNHFAIYSSTVEAFDSNMLDSPENNWCTLDPNFRAVTANTLNEGNLQCVTSTAGRSFSAGTFRMTTGKWYWEFRPDANSGGMGVAKINGTNGAGAYQSTTSTSTSTNTTDYYYGETNWVMYGDGIVHNASYVGGTASGMGSPSYPQIWGIGIDLDSDPQTITYYIDGSSVGSANLDSGFDYIPIVGDGSGAVSRTININFGQNPTFNGTETAGTNTDGNGNGLFHDSVPSGYLALCSANLPDVTIGPDSTTQADDHFNTIIWTGTGTSADAKSVGFQTDLLWAKDRQNANGHVWIDSTRGVTKYLGSNATSLEATDSTLVQSFDTDGFTTVGQGINFLNVNYAGFNWKANGGTTTTNDASATSIGTIDSVFQANDTSGFSIVTYTGTGSAGTVRHGLSVAPSLVIIKSRTTASPSNWVIGQDAIGFTGQNYFTDISGFSTNSGSFNNTAPTTSVVSIGTDNTVNQNTATYVMYCFANVEGFAKIGSYEMNSNADGPFVYTGFRPAWLLTRPVDQNGNWSVYDTVREPFNDGDSNMFFAGNATAESGFAASAVDFLSNGFKLRQSSDGYSNIASNTAIYMAFAGQPFKFSNAR